MKSILRNLYNHWVLDPCFWIHPEVRSGLPAARKRKDEIARDIPLCHRELLRFQTIHIDVDLGRAELLLNKNIRCSGNILDLVLQLDRNLLGGRGILAQNSDVNGSR